MTSKIKSSYLPELSSLLFGRKGPSMVTVNLTNRCDQRCIYCEIGQGIELPKKDTLTLDDLKWIVDEMARNKIPKLSLCGGEPFLFHDISEVVRYAHEKSIRTSVTTNGMTVHQFSEEALRILKNCSTEINVSVDSFNPEIQSLVRGKENSLEHALQSIARLKEFSIPVTVLCAISKYNHAELYHFVVRACELNIRQVLFQPLIFASNYPGSRAVSHKANLNVPADQWVFLEAELKRILVFERNHPVKTNVYRILPWIRQYISSVSLSDGTMFFDSILGNFYCREIDAIIDISFDGGIQPCGLAGSSLNIYDSRQKGLVELWQSATSEMRTALASGKFPTICNSCCHHFSRNMIASVIRSPFRNREALQLMLPLFGERLFYSIKKKIKYSNI